MKTNDAVSVDPMNARLPTLRLRPLFINICRESVFFKVAMRRTFETLRGICSCVPGVLNEFPSIMLYVRSSFQ